jgi:hypothetical protein
VIKGYNIFWVKSWQTLAALWAGALSCQKKSAPKLMDRTVYVVKFLPNDDFCVCNTLRLSKMYIVLIIIS